MSKQVTVEELAANLDAHLDDVKRGETIVVVDGDNEIASIEPPKRKGLKIIRHDPALQLQDFKPGAPPKRMEAQGADWLIEERERERSGKKYGNDTANEDRDKR
ncbi:MAG TPA: hypothetical protein VMU84_13460 [Thermoanaerobaculia bacterium]|nr:hypothetical protein [Thermoanaerobaculia bacterium]